MKLTQGKALAISIELWEWLAETGAKEKCEWNGWDKYGSMLYSCPLCEYYRAYKRKYPLQECGECPYYLKFGRCVNLNALTYNATPFLKWQSAITERSRKKYAKLFLKQLYQLRG